MKLKGYHYIIFTLGACLLFLINKTCEPAPIPEIVTTKTVNITQIKDSIRESLIKELTPIYIDTGSTKYVKGDTKWRDSIVYTNKPTRNSIEVKQYSTILKSNEAHADLKITSLGEVLDVTGLISYPKVETVLETTETTKASGLFAFTSMSTKLNNFELGLNYQHKNNVMGLISLEYDMNYKQAYLKLGVGIRLFGNR